jgi:transglutaminase/protease-like cytokinesis protein 3
VKAKDNCPDGLSFTVDSSQVNLQEVGTYPVTYIAKDLAGNETTVTVNVVVMEQTYSIEEVNMHADQVLSSIITEGMSQYDKAFAIFNYTKRNIGYINDSGKGDYVKAAYEGLVYHRGDCYVYASTAKVLLDRAGIKNMDIERIPAGKEMHYWNLVDIEDGHGWYHFDTTPRQVRAEMFLWTDAQLMEYSHANYNCYNYDRSRYPDIP